MSIRTGRIYLDNAATSFPKPDSVLEAMQYYSRDLGSAVGRSTTRAGMEVQAIVDRCRQNCARLLGVRNPQRVVFTFNGTDSLNQAIHGLVQPGDHVVSTTLEHNSVIRPLATLRQRMGVEVTLVRPDGDGRIQASAVRDALTDRTSLVICQHASNITGVIHPVDDIGQLARERGIPCCLDAAQTVGIVPIRFDDSPFDMLACPGHKALLGPLGTGLLLLSENIAGRIEPLRQGGTGTLSELQEQPLELPDRFESGNHNAVGLAGLQAATSLLLEQTPQQIQQRESQLAEQFVDGLQKFDSRLVLCHHLDVRPRLGVFSVRLAHLDPQTACSLLDQEFGIETRAGLHCAPGAHRELGQRYAGILPDDGFGSVRFSIGAFTESHHIEVALAALGELSSSL